MNLYRTFDNVQISLIGWNHFAVKYEIKIGLVDEPNWASMKE
jgi:hypothetical protein